jgi:hypothetical protein
VRVGHHFIAGFGAQRAPEMGDQRQRIGRRKSNDRNFVDGPHGHILAARLDAGLSIAGQNSDQRRKCRISIVPGTTP